MAGRRVFVPLLLTGLAARLGYIRLTSGMGWIESDAALVAFATATILEIARTTCRGSTTSWLRWRLPPPSPPTSSPPPR